MSETVVDTATSSATGGGTNVRFAAANAPTRSWDEQSFSPARGFPGALCFHEQRLWFGGSAGQPDGVWASRIGRYFDFDVGDGLDNDAIWVTVGSSDISNVRHLVSNRSLQVFTATAEFAVPFRQERPITPSTIRIARQGTYGASGVPPVAFDGATVFVQATGRAVREMVFNDAQGGFEITDLTVVASHLVRSPVALAYVYGSAERNEQYAVVVNGDGTMPVFLSARAEKVAGWVMWTTPGAAGTDAFESVCVIGGQVFVVARRGAERWLEVFEPGWTWLLDGAQRLTQPSPTAAWTLPADYVEQSVAVCRMDGSYIGVFTVPLNRTITLPAPESQILVGYDFPVEVETLPPNVELPNGALYGSPRRIAKVQTILNETLNVRVEGQGLVVQPLLRPTYDPPRTLDAGFWRFDEDGAHAQQGMDDAPLGPPTAAVVTGVREFHLLGYARQPSLTISQAAPAPMRLLGLIAEVGF